MTDEAGKFGDRVMEARQALSLSVTAAAEQSRVVQGAWDKIEVGDLSRIGPISLLRILGFLASAGISVQWLVTGNGRMTVADPNLHHARETAKLLAAELREYNLELIVRPMAAGTLERIADEGS